MELNALLNINGGQWPAMPPQQQQQQHQTAVAHIEPPRAIVKQEPLELPMIKMECMSPGMSSSCGSPHSTVGLSGSFTSTDSGLVTSDYGSEASEGTQSDGMLRMIRSLMQ